MFILSVQNYHILLFYSYIYTPIRDKIAIRCM